MKLTDAELADKRPAVIILAHSWPPDANVGAVRPVYLSHQLAKLGFRPVVITVLGKYHELRNEGGIAGSASAHVIRTRCLRNPRYAYLGLKAFLSRLVHGGEGAASSSDATAVESTVDPAVGHIGLKKNFLSLLYTPDEFLGWFPFALVATLRAISRYRAVCIISTGPPHTSHLVAMCAKGIRGVPWIADLRDPWAWHDLPADTPKRWSDRINARLEKAMVSRADRVVCVTRAVTQAYAAKYASAAPSKWLTITNGFDIDEFVALGNVHPADRFTISYVGGFDFQRSPELLLRAVAALIDEGAIDPRRIAIRFVGPCEYANGRSTSSIISELGLADVAKIVSLVPRPEALRELLRAHVLLLLAGTQRMSVAAKVYEYIAAGRPILAVTDGGAAAEIIGRIGVGQVVASDDLAGTKSTIFAWYERYIREDLAPKGSCPSLSDAALDYSWVRLGAQYAKLIREISTCNSI